MLLTNLGIGPESKKKKCAPTTTATPKKLDTLKADVLKEDKRKGTRLVSDPWCDYVVVSDTLKGLVPVAVRKPKAEPRDTAELPVLNPDDPIDLDSSPEPLLRTNELEGTKAAEAELEKVVEVEKPVEVELEAEKEVETETTDVGATKPKSPEVVAHEPERRKSIIEEEVLVITVPSSATTPVPPKDDIEDNPVNVDQTFVAHDEEGSPICPEETLGDYYYRSYSEKRASEIHAPVWKLKQGDTFSDWQERSHDQTYHSYLEETASSTSTTHRIVREWRIMHREWDAFEASKKEVADEKAKVATLRAKLDANQAKFESEQKTEEWSTVGWKSKRALRTDVTNLKGEIEKLKKEKAEAEVAHDEARSHREKSKRRELQTCATLALRNKEIEELTSLLSEAARRLAETQEKLENSETARVTAESLVEPLKNDLLWMRHHGIINVANSILNSIDLDQTVTNLMAIVHSDGYTQGYAKCTQHVNDALRVDWDNSKFATHGVDIGVAHATA
ncbi:hypothetical protein Hanom_Chr06g00555651 [Helianthus anomalus]